MLTSTTSHDSRRSLQKYAANTLSYRLLRSRSRKHNSVSLTSPPSSASQTVTVSSSALLLLFTLQIFILLPPIYCDVLQASPSSSSPSDRIHKQMTVDELRRVFQVEHHDQVPQYEVVPIHFLRRTKRSAEEDQHRELHLSAFGKDLQLNLKPNSDFQERAERMKVIVAETDRDTGKLDYREEKSGPEELHWVGTAYHDGPNGAAVLVSAQQPDGQLTLDGTIGNDYVIRPVPRSLATRASQPSSAPGRDDDELFLDEDDKKQDTTTKHIAVGGGPVPTAKVPKLQSLSKKNKKDLTHTHELLGKGSHFVFKRKMNQDDHHSDYLELEPSGSPMLNLTGSIMGHSPTSTNSSSSPLRRSKRQSPDAVWPEVLLVVDYDSYILHGATSRDVKRYFISFWNGVDLRYKLLSHPQIRVSLAGMIVAKDRDATPYLERNRLRSPNADAVDAAGALTDMGKYLYREDRLPTYDLAVVITKLDMCRRRYEGGRCNRGTAGFAYVGGACVVNKRLEKVNSVAIIEDSGGFSGIIVAAHEVGHLLGCVHDGSPPPSYLGGPGATRCPWEDGFIMSDLRHTERGFRWSSCSVDQFKHFLNGETATCLYNYPHENQLLPRVLPGTMLSLDEQCKRDRGTNACFKDARVCAQLFCFDSASGYCVSYRPAAEGSPCGDGQVCRNGKCAAELDNIIPDYTHVTQTVVSRRDSPASSELDSVMADEPPHSPQGLRPSAGPPQRRRGSNNMRNKKSLSRAHGYQGDEGPVMSARNDQIQQPVCQDTMARMAGSLTCPQFLERFGYRYCSHSHMKQNCCASHALLCHGRS